MAEQVVARQIIIDLTRTLTRTYSFTPGTGTNTTIKSSVPREPLEREARNRGMTLEEFTNKFEGEWHFGDFEGLYVRYVEKSQNSTGSKET